MGIIRNLAFLSIGILLFSCNPNPVRIPKTSTIEPTSTFEIITSITETQIPKETATPTFTVTIPALPDSPTPKPIPQICSPLAEQSVIEIVDIVTDPYNPPKAGKDERHHGTDLAYYRRKDRISIEGELVQALLTGRVVAVVKDQLPYGNMVIIETMREKLPIEIISQFDIAEDDALYTLYAHLKNSPLVTLQDQIDCGQALGEVGTTGYNIVNPHIHIETRIGPANHVFFGGMAYYDTQTTEVERSNYELWRTSGEFRHFDPIDLLNMYLDNWIR